MCGVLGADLLAACCITLTCPTRDMCVVLGADLLAACCTTLTCPTRDMCVLFQVLLSTSMVLFAMAVI